MTDATIEQLADASHERLMSRLASTPFDINMLSHQPEGNTALASRVRGHPLADAIKTIVLRVKLSRKSRRYVLAVVCGHHRVNVANVARSFGGIDCRFADPKTAYNLTGCVSGCVMPLSLQDDIPVIADFAVLDRKTVWFNSGRLDHSIGMRTRDWVALARPRLDAISQADPASPAAEICA